MATIFVTGGAGYVGSHVAKALARAGHLPVTYDNLARGHRELVRWGPLEIGDLLDAPRLAEALDRWKPEAVMHFAALIEVGESVRKPALYRRNNVEGSRALLAAMAERGLAKIVFSSTAAVYGDTAVQPITESVHTAPTSPYGETKLAVEHLIAEGGFHHAIFRYFNAAGADPDGETGECHEPESHLIPLAIAAALGGGPALRMFGDDYPTPDGTCVRDYVHVADIAQAHVMALDRILGGGPSFLANLGTGQGTSVRDVIRTIEAASGRAVPVQRDTRRPGDPAILVADPAAASRLLQWRASRHLTEIVRDALNWALVRQKAVASQAPAR